MTSTSTPESKHIVPAATPHAVLPTPRRVPPWAAYLVLICCYAAIFSPWWRAVWPGPPLPAGPAPQDWLPWGGRQWITHAVNCVLVLGIALAVTRWLGLRLSDIGIRPVWARGDRRRWRRQGRAVFHAVLAAYVAATLLRGLLATLTGGMPIDQADPVGLALATLPVAPMTSFEEEVITVALLVLLLRAGGQHPVAMMVVAGVAKTLYHLPSMGLPAVAVAIPAVVCVWAYHRTGRLTPIIAAHIAVNVLPIAGVLIATGAVAALG